MGNIADEIHLDIGIYDSLDFDRLLPAELWINPSRLWPPSSHQHHVQGVSRRTKPGPLFTFYCYYDDQREMRQECSAQSSKRSGGAEVMFSIRAYSYLMWVNIEHDILNHHHAKSCPPHVLSVW